MSSNSSEILNYLITKLPNTEQESSFLFYFKLFSFLIIIIITFSFGLLPLFFANYRQGLIVLNYANPFSGGIFIGIGLFHLLPDASYNFEQYYKTPEGKKCFFFGFPMS
jgi:zinc transporter ZupT